MTLILQVAAPTLSPSPPRSLPSTMNPSTPIIVLFLALCCSCDDPALLDVTSLAGDWRLVVTTIQGNAVTAEASHEVVFVEEETGLSVSGAAGDSLHVSIAGGCGKAVVDIHETSFDDHEDDVVEDEEDEDDGAFSRGKLLHAFTNLCLRKGTSISSGTLQSKERFSVSVSVDHIVLRRWRPEEEELWSFTRSGAGGEEDGDVLLRYSPSLVAVAVFLLFQVIQDYL